MLITLTEKSIILEDALRHVRNPSCGAVAFFEGNIRNLNQGEKVLGLEYQVYPSFFQTEVQRIFAEIKSKWPIHELALIQRTGKLDVGETGIVIAISSPHRREALQALDYTIEEFKKRAPVWKKEHTTEGENWVVCHHGH